MYQGNKKTEQISVIQKILNGDKNWKVIGRTDGGELIEVTPIMIIAERMDPAAGRENYNGILDSQVSETGMDYHVDNLIQSVTELIRKLGIPAHIKGYQYMREAILMCADQPDYLSSVTGKLYPAIAKKYETTSSRVERAIRHAIEVSCKRGDQALHRHLFGPGEEGERAKPTNSEFIASVSDLCRIDK